MAAIKDTAAGEFTFEYNDVQFGGNGTYDMHWPQIDTTAELVYDDSGRDHIGWDVNVVIRSVIFKGTKTAAATAIDTWEITSKMLTPNKRLKVAKGYGFEIAADGATSDRDISDKVDLYGVRPIRFTLKPIPGIEGCAMEFVFKYRVNRYCDDDTYFHRRWIKSWSHRTDYQVDVSGTHTLQLTYTLHTLAQADDRGYWTAEQMLSDPASATVVTVPIPSGFHITSINTQSSPDKTSVQRVVTMQQFLGDRPPLGIIRSGGSFSIDLGENQKSYFNTAIASLERTYEVSRTAQYTVAPLAFLMEVIHARTKIIAGLTVNSTDATHQYSVILANMKITRGRGDDSRFWKCSASWILTGCISNLITSAVTFETPPEPDESIWNLTAGAGTYANNLRLREDVANDSATTLNDDTKDSPPSTKTITYLTQPVSPAYAVYNLTCSTASIPAKLSWMHYDVTVKVLTDAMVSQHIRMYPNRPRTHQSDTGAGGVTTISTYAGTPTTSGENEAPRALEEAGYGTQVVQYSFVGIRLGHYPSVPDLKTINGQSIEGAMAVKTRADPIKKLGSIFGCPVWLLKSTTLYYLTEPIQDIGRTEEVTACITYSP